MCPRQGMQLCQKNIQAQRKRQGYILFASQWEPRAKVEPGSGKHSVHTHIPKDPNCDICLKTKIVRASCTRRADTVVPRAERFGDLITVDHKARSEESESRNNHRYAVAQDVATQWIQSYPCKQKLPRIPRRT